MKKILSYLISHSRTAHYATGLYIPRALLVWSSTAGLNLIGSAIEYAANGCTPLAWLLLCNTLAPAAVLTAMAYVQRGNLIQD